MNERHCIHFQMLPMSKRITYSMTLLVLGVGYLFAMIHVFSSHAGRDGDPSLSVDDIRIAYSGSQADTRLEAALKGPMQSMLKDAEAKEIIAWVRSGAEEEAYNSTVKPIMEQRCVACHNGSNPHVPLFTNYEEVSKTVEMDTGMDLFTLVRVSHIHLFGITFIFFLTSLIFCHAYMKRVVWKCVILAVPFLSILVDILSWYATKMWPPFAIVVMASGVLMGLSFTAQWFISMFQMWLYKLPEEVIESDGVLPCIGESCDAQAKA